MKITSGRKFREVRGRMFPRIRRGRPSVARFCRGVRGALLLSLPPWGKPVLHAPQKQKPRRHIAVGVQRRCLHGSTRVFHSGCVRLCAVSHREGVVPVPACRGILQPVNPISCGGVCTDMSHSVVAIIDPFSEFVKPRTKIFAPDQSCAFLRRLYSERGLTNSRQLRSPRSTAQISTSAVAILVATGTLCTSHRRSS